MSPHSDSLASFPAGGVAVVVGAGGGIGAALLARLKRDRRFDTVLAAGRSQPLPLHLDDETSIEQAMRTAASRGPLRLVLVATGFLHGNGRHPERRLRELDPQHLAQAFAINAIGPALVMKHALPRLAAPGKSAFAALSARVGSIGDNRLGGWHAYRASKAALNQLVHTAAIELARLAPEALCVALHPGTVDTAMSRPFARRDLAVHTPETAATHLLSVLDRIGPADSGGFFDWRGAPVPW